MSSNKWDVLPLDEDTKKLGKISRVRVNDSTMEIYNGKTKPITFSYNESTSEDLSNRTHWQCDKKPGI